MKELRELLNEAERFREKRAGLARNLRTLDEKHKHEAEALESRYISVINNYEAERQANISSIESRAKKEIADYTQIKNSLHSFLEPVRQWCPKSPQTDYMPNPSRVNEEELNQLITMLQEQGIVAWIKRTFKIGGYSSRAAMALDLYRKIEDACAYCNEKISGIEINAENERNAQITTTRRKISAAQEQLKKERHELEFKQKAEKENALFSINSFDNSVELRTLREKSKKLQADAENSCGVWGEYSASSKMPERLLLCEAKTDLPNNNGIDTAMVLPVWIDLFESNIIVVTSNNVSVSSTSGKEKLFVRKLIARMLKTIPSECCSYSVFDSLHKGGSLERLIDVTNVGTTDLNFDLFTSNDSDAKVVSCAERRKFLRNRPAEIIQFIAGRKKSLFEYNKDTGEFEFPFTWYIDFNFPEDPDRRLEEDVRELFVNASAAGYSFVFVTTDRGYEKIRDIAKRCTKTEVMHINADQLICEEGDLSVRYLGTEAPNTEQIYNFMTALKKYYDDGDTVDNRINSVFGSKGIDGRDASNKLTVPMALDSRGRLIDLELGGEGSVHGFISGGTNSGKSTLLHTIILSACLHYNPNDLEMWLVDYKQTEFYLYKKNTPPHIKLIGVSKTADFTFSFLDKIASEADRRTELLNRFDAQDLEEYRKHKEEDGYENIPRLFIIIDEFHEMSQFVSSDLEYKNKLENTLREYRAQGITCLLADQTFSTGPSGLTQAAKNQIGLRIAMRNETSPQEIKDTLEVDRAMYSDSMQHTISVMRQGDFIMKTYVRNSHGDIKDIKLEKYKALYTKGDDIAPIGRALREFYNGQYKQELLYVNTKEQTAWDDSDLASLDKSEPLRYPNVRMYLGRAATLRPCFGLDMGRQPDENLSIVGGTAHQRWELIAAIMKSCRYRKYKLIVFMAEFSDLMNDFGSDIRKLCADVPEAELIETTEAWCSKLTDLEKTIDNRSNSEDVICLFIGLEIAAIEFERLQEKTAGNTFQMITERRRQLAERYGTAVSDESSESEGSIASETAVFNVLPIIDKLFSSGARSGIRCVAEVSVYRKFSKILKIKDMCRHKVAFSMSADDCLMYLGNSNFQKSIGGTAVYGDGGKEVRKLLPYKL